MEFAARLPQHLKFRPGRSKYLLRKAFSELLPAENLNRRKMGFGVPVGIWFRGPLRDLLSDTLLAHDSRVGEYLDRDLIASIADAHVQQRTDGSKQLWALLMLEMWHREVVEGPQASTGSLPGAVVT
jgi:asparagine synthase (glutamine-hydrolysing)